MKKVKGSITTPFQFLLKINISQGKPIKIIQKPIKIEQKPIFS